MDGDDDAGRLGKAAAFQELRIGGIAVIDVVAVAAIAGDRAARRNRRRYRECHVPAAARTRPCRRGHSRRRSRVLSGRRADGQVRGRAACRAAAAPPSCRAASERSGVSAMVTDVTASVKLARRDSTKPAVAAMPIPTNANSPPGPSSRPVSTATGHDKRNSLPSTDQQKRLHARSGRRHCRAAKAARATIRGSRYSFRR